MAPVKNGRILFNSVPKGYPEPGKTTVYDESETIDLENVPLNGGYLVKVLYLSVDPYMRGRMREPHIESYAPAFALGQPTNGVGVGVVLRSESEGFKKSDHVTGFIPHQQYVIVDKKPAMPLMVIDKTFNIPLSVYAGGAAGGTGKTAYHAWKEFSKAKSGETVYVTTGAGPVGSVVIQLAKKDGLKVIASAGSDDKVAFMKECGADVAFNYKKEDVKDVLKREGGIDIYWDNVGGYQLEAALDASKNGGRFIECGMISQYNGEPYHVKNLMQIVAKALTFNGFIVGRDLAPKWDEEFYKVVPELISKGEIKYKEDIIEGLDKTGDAMRKVQTGENTGKSIVKVADE